MGTSRGTGSMFIAELIEINLLHIFNLELTKLNWLPIKTTLNIKGGVGKFEKPARDTLFVIFHGMLLTSR